MEWWLTETGLRFFAGWTRGWSKLSREIRNPGYVEPEEPDGQAGYWRG